MAKILYQTTHGTEDPTRAGLTFIAANGAKEAGHEPVVVLIADATFLMKSDIPKSVTPVGFGPLSDIMAITIANQTPIHV